MMTRTQKIAAGKIWHVYPDPGEAQLKDEAIEFEGSRTACFAYVRNKYGMRAYRKGTIRIGQLIMELASEAAAAKRKELKFLNSTP